MLLVLLAMLVALEVAEEESACKTRLRLSLPPPLVGWGLPFRFEGLDAVAVLSLSAAAEVEVVAAAFTRTALPFIPSVGLLLLLLLLFPLSPRGRLAPTTVFALSWFEAGVAFSSVV